MKLLIKFVELKVAERAIEKKMEAAKRRSIFRQLGWIQKTAKRSIRKSKKTSDPNTPPRSHMSGGASLRSIMFWFAKDGSSGVVGPMKFNKTPTPSGAKTIPNLLEKGGAVVAKKASVVPLTVAGLTKTRSVKGKPIIVKDLGKGPVKIIPRKRTYAPRPFMEPAMEKAIAEGIMDKSFAGTFE